MDVITALIASFLGAVIALVGAFAFELRREEVARAGAARALFFELAQNAGWLRKAIEFETYIPLDVSTWKDARLTLSSAVSPADFATIAHGYSHLLSILAAEAATSASKKKGIVGAAKDAIPFVEAAGILLLHRGWPKQSDRRDLASRLEELTGVPTTTWTHGPTT